MSSAADPEQLWVLEQWEHILCGQRPAQLRGASCPHRVALSTGKMEVPSTDLSAFHVQHMALGTLPVPVNHS